jgi:benzodiazapine receptor
MASAFRLVTCLALCFAVAVAGALVTRPEIPSWYTFLVKPSWTPPNWVFPVAWNLLYALMAISLWRLWERAREGTADASYAIGLFLVQLALNAAWSPMFFGFHAIRTGLAIIAAIAIALIATIIVAYRVDRPAAWLLVPYLGWILYAASLNAAIAILNS